MKLVCSNRKSQRFEKKGLAPYHAISPPFPLQIHAQKDECRDWGPGRPYQVLSSLHAVIYTFLVNEWTFFFFGYILIAKIVVKILPRSAVKQRDYWGASRDYFHRNHNHHLHHYITTATTMIPPLLLQLSWGWFWHTVYMPSLEFQR